MRTATTVLVGLAFVVLATAADGNKGPKPTYTLTANQLAKEFKDDPAAAKKKYGAKPLPEVRLSGTATLAIGPASDTELLIENASKIPIRLGVKQRPQKFPVKFTATVTYKGYFDMARELSLTASKITYE